MDRPYKRGVPGNTKNVLSEVQDYGKAEDLGFKVRDPEMEN